MKYRLLPLASGGEGRDVGPDVEDKKFAEGGMRPERASVIMWAKFNKDLQYK